MGDSDEDIYDEAISKPAGLSNLKSRFEKPSIQPYKPAGLGVKPVLPTKPQNNTVLRKNGTASNSTPKKRDSKLVIPDAFSKPDNVTSPPPLSPKPQIPVTPKKVSSINSIPTSKSAEEMKTPKDEPKQDFSMRPKGTSTEKVVPRTAVTSMVHELAQKGGQSAFKPVDKIHPKESEIKFKSILNKFSEVKSDAPVMRRKSNIRNNQPLKRKSFKRDDDGNKFLLVDKTKIDSTVEIMAPAKPEALDLNIDVDAISADFQEAVNKYVKANVVEDEEEIYDDTANMSRGSAVSMIEEFTEDDEMQWKQVVEEEPLPPPPPDLLTEETYDDATSAVGAPSVIAVDDDDQETYEELPDELLPNQTGTDSSADSSTLSQGPISNNVDGQENSAASEQDEKSKKKLKDKKSKDKDKVKEKEKAKAKERELKLQEEKKKKMEKTNKEIMKNFKITPIDVDRCIGRGKVKESNPGGGKYVLSVTEGQLVSIVKMDIKEKKYKGKWLVKTEENEVGLLDSQNVEMMAGTGGDGLKAQVNQIDGEEYEDVPDANNDAAPLEEDDIYEQM